MCVQVSTFESSDLWLRILAAEKAGLIKVDLEFKKDKVRGGGGAPGCVCVCRLAGAARCVLGTKTGCAVLCSATTLAYPTQPQPTQNPKPNPAHGPVEACQCVTLITHPHPTTPTSTHPHPHPKTRVQDPVEEISEVYLSDNTSDAALEWNKWRKEVVQYSVRDKIVPALLQVREGLWVVFEGGRGGGEGSIPPLSGGVEGRGGDASGLWLKDRSE